LHGTPPRILEVNPSTGTQSIISTGGFLDGVTSQVVFYHNNDQGDGILTAPDAATSRPSGAAAGATHPGIALAVALVMNAKKGLPASLADASS
jgi:hypothetical protein